MHGEAQAVKRTDDEANRHLSILIVAENASDRFGGEAILPLHYFRFLRNRGIPAWLITHARVREELSASIPQHLDRVYFIEDSRLHRILWRIGSPLSARLRYLTTEFLARLLTQRAQRILARKLVTRFDIDVIHQPTPVSPREPSLLVDVGAPVVIGPMNGGVDYPPAFRTHDSAVTQIVVAIGRAWASCLSYLFQGKRRASVLLVANERSRTALARGSAASVFQLTENGVDASVWKPNRALRNTSSVCRFAFSGRLIRSKGVDLWLRSFEEAARTCAISGLIIGDGPEREALMTHAQRAGILASEPNQPGKVFFAGWQSQAKAAELLSTQDCLVLPSLFESGGAVVLEAMALELPVIATNWGGPTDYVDSSCGILIAPDSAEHLIGGFAGAMVRLAQDPDLRARMGSAGRGKVEQHYTWDRKIDSVIGFYRYAVRSSVRVGCVVASVVAEIPIGLAFV